MNKYKQQALDDMLNNTLSFLVRNYKTAEELDAAITSGNFDGKLYERKKEVAELRLENGEGEYILSEGSTWIVAYYGILSRFYSDNQEYFDNAASRTLTA